MGISEQHHIPRIRLWLPWSPGRWVGGGPWGLAVAELSWEGEAKNGAGGNYVLALSPTPTEFI